MCFPLRAVPSNPCPNPDPLSGLTPRQIEAVAAWACGVGGRLCSLTQIGERMSGAQVKKSAVCRLIRRGLAKIRANGWRLEDVPAFASRFRLAA